MNYRASLPYCPFCKEGHEDEPDAALPTRAPVEGPDHLGSLTVEEDRCPECNGLVPFHSDACPLRVEFDEAES